MKTSVLLALAAGSTSLLAAEHAFAAGTALDVQSARGTGMASATTAMIDDSSAIFYNAAGIARGKKLDLQAGVSLIVPSFRFTSPTGQESSLPFYVVPPATAYGTLGLTDNITVGIGVFTPYGLKIDWGDTAWQGRRFLTKATLQTFVANPTVAARFGPNGMVRIGVGFQLMRATVELERQIAFPGQEGSVDLGASAWGVGANGGIQIDAIKKYLTFGAHYRSAIKTNFDNGKAHFENVPAALAPTIHDQAVQTSLVHPDQFAFGVASRPIDALVIDFDLVMLGWSRFRSIDLHFPDDLSRSLDSHEPKHWSNSVNLHLGGEYLIDDHFRARAGVLYDPNPSPDDTRLPDIPDADRLNLAIGGSYVHQTGFRVDLAYQHLVMFTATSTAPAFPGEYGGAVNILGISLGYSTPERKEPQEPSAPPASTEPVAAPPAPPETVAPPVSPPPPPLPPPEPTTPPTTTTPEPTTPPP